MAEASKPDPEELLAHAQDLRRLARALVSDPHAADDLAQDAWVELLEGRANPAGTRERSAWFFGLLRNLRRERARGEGRRSSREARSARPLEVRGEHEIVERLETFRALAREVEQLDEPYRTSLWQRYFVGESSEEIAAREGVSPATVRSQWMRALAKLRERLDRREGGREKWMSALLLVADAAPATRATNGGTTLFAASALLATILATAYVAVPDAPRATATEAAWDESDPDESADAELVDVGRASRAAVAQLGTSTADVARAPLRIALVDAYTREPLPAARVRVRSADAVGEWTSDDRGRVETSALALGSVGVEVIDDPDAPSTRLAGEARAFRRARPLVHDGNGEIELAVASGPTWDLALEMPEHVSAHGLVARLSARADDGPRSYATARVRRDGARAWVRFGADGSALAGGGPWILRVETPDARHAGEALVESLRGRSAVALRLVERAELVVRVRDAGGSALDARVEVRAADGSRIASGSTAGGAFRARGLLPGPVRVLATGFGLAPIEAEVDARAPANDVEIVSRDEVPRERVSGIVRHRLAPGASLRVVLRDSRGVEIARTITNDDAQRARDAFEFAFEDVPVGEHELRAESRRAWTWEPPRLRVVPPAVGLEIVAGTADETGSFVVRAHDAATGIAIEHFDVSLEVDGSRPIERSTSIAGVTLPVLPDDARVAWTVAAAGYAPARGDESAIRRGALRSSLDVVLERGSGLFVRAVDDASGAPIAGVEIAADGRVVARTDERGEATIATPRALDARLDGHAIVGGDVDPASGSWRSDSARRVEIRLARRP